MVDEPTRNASPDEAATADQSASPHGDEWQDGFARLLSDFDEGLQAAVQSARQQAAAAVQSVKARGAEMLAGLQRQREEQDAQQAALEQRVADVQANIEQVEDEVRLSREEADRESADLIDAARRRAEAIVADAEARAAEIIAEARSRAAGQAGAGDGTSATSGEPRNVEGRLRGLSERVGRLLSSPAGIATAGAVGLGAAGLAAAAASSGGSLAAPTQPAPDTTYGGTGDEEEAEDFEAAEEALDVEEAADHAATQVLPSTATSAAPVPAADETGEDVPVQVGAGRPWSTDVETDEEEEVKAEAASVLPVWPTSDDGAEAEAADERPTTVTAAMEDEPIFMRRAPNLVDDHEEAEAAAEEPAAAAEAAPQPEEEPAVVGPTGAVTQTLIFQSVPNFQAALALERSLKAMSEVREVRVADFDERQLTFQVTHELGSQLPRVLLTQRGGELELVEARPERVEFMFRS